MGEVVFYALTEDGRRLELENEVAEGGILWRLPKASLADTDRVRIFCDNFNTRAGDKGFYLMPESTGSYGAPLVSFREREDCSFKTGTITLSHFAVGLSDATYLVMVDRSYKYTCYGECENGHYRIYLSFDFTVQPPADDICLRLFEFPAETDYNGIAAFVRSYRLERGEIRTLREKCAERAELDYARKYPMIRIRMGWKPVPVTVLHQTVENEPPMHVACTFADVRDFADKLKEAGVEGAQLCLVGWNQKGHDGRWPQMFPVEEAFGGEAELRKTIEYVQSLGYRITCHTNSLDHYEIADMFDRNVLAYRADGTVITAGEWSGGVCHHACPTHQLRLTKELLPKVAELGFKGIHYIDVLSIVYPDACYHKDHPCTTREGFEYMREIMRVTTELFGGFASEGGIDFTLGGLDFSLYNRFKSCFLPSTKPFVDRFIPLYELIYHGIVLYNPSSTSVNYPIKSADETNTVKLLGSLPTFYIYSKFKTGGGNWMGEVDLTCNNSEEIKKSVEAVKAAYDAYSPERQFVFIRSLDIIEDGLYAITYDDGYCVVGNYTDKELVYNGMPVSAHNFIELKNS